MTSNHNSKSPDAEHPDSKQAAVINDDLFPMPRAKMTARDILDQAGASKNHVLQRDYNSPIDHVFHDDDTVDLREGNVFKAIPRRSPVPCGDPNAKPKLAFIVDDVWAVTVAAQQTGHSVKRLVSLPDNATLFRDYVSPNDELVTDSAVICFMDGPVFYTRGGGHADICVEITIDGVKHKIAAGKTTVGELKKIGKVPVADELIQLIAGKLTPLADDATVCIAGGEEFVSHPRCGVSS